MLDLQNRFNEEIRMQQLEKLRYATSSSLTDLWHDNFVNGEYVIAYEINSYVHSKIKYMLAKVRFQGRINTV